MYDTGNDNSDVSDISPGDLANIVKGVDDMDDALFGFQTKRQDSHKSKVSADEVKSVRPTSSDKKQQSGNFSDFPEGDLLADISLSDDDFYDVGKKSPAISKNRDTSLTTPANTSTQEKLTKSKKIANLFGLDDEDDVLVGSKKKQEGAADWLGIKDSPVKTMPDPPVPERRKSLSSAVEGENLFEVKTPLKTKKSELFDVKTTLTKEIGLKDSELVNVSDKPKTEVTKPENYKINASKTGSVFELLGDKIEPKNTEGSKDKKSAVFDELFGDTDISQRKTSQRSSVARVAESINLEVSGPPTGNESSLGLYTPSSGAARRPGLGRRRETSLAATTPPTSLLFQEDWLAPSSQQEEKRVTTPQHAKLEVKSSAVEVHDSLPTWLGGSGIPDSKHQTKSSVEAVQEKPMEKSEPEITITTTTASAFPEKKAVKDKVEKQAVDAVREVPADSSEQSRQTALALQRTEAQLLAALELQTTQNSLVAVCARQRNILDCQEKQLAQLVTRQIDKQTLVEKQLTAQQQRIEQLLEVLSSNLPATTIEPLGVVQTERNKVEIVSEEMLQQQRLITNNLEVEIQKAALENEELRMRIKLMEKHYKMEFESLQMQHRREIESWEDQLIKQKELADQLSDDFKKRIAQLKENEAELIAQHNERVQRLREERAEDMKQLVHFHTMTMEQMTILGKLAAPYIRENQKPSETWKHLDTNEISEKEEELLKKEKYLSGVQQKLESQRETLENQIDEREAKLEQEKMKMDELARDLKREQYQLKYKQDQLNQERKHLEEQHHTQRKMLEDMQEKVMSEQTQLTSERLALAEDKAKLDALAKLQGVSGTTSFDVLQSKAEVHGALEAARSAEMQAVEEKRRLKDKERTLDTQRWKLQEMEEDLNAKAQHLDQLMKVSDAKQEASQKTLEEAKETEKRAEEKLLEVERRKKELREKEQNIMRVKLDIAHEEIRVNRKREELEHILPQLSINEAVTLQPIKDIIDPKMLIMKLRAEREFDVLSK